MARHVRSKSMLNEATEIAATMLDPATVKPRKRSKSIINTATKSDPDKQRIATPWAFIHALEQRFGTPVDFDLAADKDNAKAAAFFDLESDALKRPWELLSTNYQVRTGGVSGWSRLAFLNPSFAHIKPWAHKVAECRWLKRWTVMLVPASYSTDWFIDLKKKVVCDAIPRIQFEGATHLYPKDLALFIAGFGLVGGGYWDWRVSYAQYCIEHSITPDTVHLRGTTRLPDYQNSPVFPDYDWTPNPFASVMDWVPAMESQLSIDQT
jgi:phage N-6-adenine-methyltransferase